MQPAKTFDEEASRQLLNSLERAIFLLDPLRGSILAASPLMQQLLDYSAEDIANRQLAELSVESDRPSNQAKVKQFCADGHLRCKDLPLRTRDGLTVNMEFQNLGVTPDGAFLIDGILHSILPRPPASTTALPLANTVEPVTESTPNYRQVFLEEARSECERAVRYQRNLAMVCIELERIETGNETNGRRLADLLLSNLTASLEQTLRVCDLAGRTGVGEWVVLLPEVDAEGARHVVERLHQTLARQVVAGKNGDARTLEARIGVASSSGPDANYEVLHAQAQATRQAQKLTTATTH